MNFWPEFLASSWGREFVAGGFGGIGGVITGYPLDTIRIWQQQSSKASSAFSILRNVVATEGPAALYKGMAAPLASVTFQNAMVFQIYAVLSQALDSSVSAADPPSHKAVALGGFGTGAFQSLILTPVQLVKIRLQLQNNSYTKLHQSDPYKGPVSVATSIFKTQGIKGMFRGLNITLLRDAPSHGFSTSTHMRICGRSFTLAAERVAKKA
ncbi:mitochondrial arginine transporter bac2 [Quercus suber]|uniref:Mitochondrial arginine transporter bac2 n=1 Tax=Quercus suber TaxID=58331 RepID=A0AAW0KYY1_QUESU